jgi:hypothetical protein
VFSAAVWAPVAASGKRAGQAQVALEQRRAVRYGLAMFGIALVLFRI